MRHTTNLTKDKMLAKVIMSPLDIERMNPAMWRGSVHPQRQTLGATSPRTACRIPGPVPDGGLYRGRRLGDRSARGATPPQSFSRMTARLSSGLLEAAALP